MLLESNVVRSPSQSTIKALDLNYTKPKQKIVNSSLNYHRQKYLDMKKRKAQPINTEEFYTITRYLQHNKVSCFKYNYCLDAEIQNHSSFQSFLQLDSEGEKLIITNRKPVDDFEYTLSNDPKEIKKLRKEYSQRRREYEKQTKEAMAKLGFESSDDEEYLNTELDEDIDEIDFKNFQSSATCSVSDIQGFIFGGFSSRFWMLRKHIIQLDYKNMNQVPFYCWNCITLELPNRQIDLVIRDQEDMNKLLKFLIFRLKTVDGQRGSALGVLEALNQQTRKELKKGGEAEKNIQLRMHEIN